MHFTILVYFDFGYVCLLWYSTASRKINSIIFLHLKIVTLILNGVTPALEEKVFKMMTVLTKRYVNHSNVQITSIAKGEQPAMFSLEDVIVQKIFLEWIVH